LPVRLGNGSILPFYVDHPSPEQKTDNLTLVLLAVAFNLKDLSFVLLETDQRVYVFLGFGMAELRICIHLFEQKNVIALFVFMQTTLQILRIRFCIVLFFQMLRTVF